MDLFNLDGKGKDNTLPISEPSGEDKALLISRISSLEERKRELPESASATDIAQVDLEIGRMLVGLEKGDEAWPLVRSCFDVFIENEDWENAADACDVLFRSELDGSMSALGQGVWLAVTYPIDPELTLALLEHLIDETPDDADGAAVAASTGVFLTDMRTEGKQHENLSFFANQLLGRVARRHSKVETKEEFDAWLEKLELMDPDKFLVRLRNVIEVLVQEDWWLDREQLQSRLPVN